MFAINCSVILALCLWLPPVFSQWHDWQRAGEIGLILLASVALLIQRASPSPAQGRVPGAVLGTLGAFLACGLVSAALAVRPAFALAEVAVFAGLVVLAYATFEATVRSPQHTLRAILALSVSILLVLVTRAFTVMVSAPFNGVAAEPAQVHGFSNPRFIGQLFVFLIPLVSLPLIGFIDLSALQRRAVWLLLVCAWAVLYFSGTRGALMGLTVAGGALLFCGSIARQLMRIQSVSAATGLLLYWMCDRALPWALGVAESGRVLGVMRAGLSRRDLLWAEAAAEVQRHPLLGVGPMHYALDLKPAGAHPHQALLQIAGEWGVPAMLLLMTLVVAMIRFVSSVRHRDQASVGRAVLLTAFVASTSQGMVDGLVVVPYTQLWYVLVVGVLCGLCAQATPVQSGNGFTQSRQMGVAGLVAGSYLAVFAAQTFPCVAPSSAVYLTQFGEVLRPRFWSQGFIGQDFFPADGTCPTVKP